MTQPAAVGPGAVTPERPAPGWSDASSGSDATSRGIVIGAVVVVVLTLVAAGGALLRRRP
jgi:hypothetical protein